MRWLFWGSAVVIAYVYAGYPLLLAAWARVVDRRPARRDVPDRRWPSVSCIVAARNESTRLPSRIGNLIALEYPLPIEIIVVSDGSTDRTREALAPFTRVRLIELPPGGKAAALNAGVAAASGDVLLFADARQEFAPDALLKLILNFADPKVGGATGELVLDAEQPGAGRMSSSVGEGVGLYWKYEKWLRRKESRVWSTLGATGAIYALRRTLWKPLPHQTLLDDVLAPMRAVLAGYRIVFEEEARAFDRVAANVAAETARKTRTLAGNYQLLALEPTLMWPWRNPVWVQFVSHKLGRLIVPWALLLGFAANVALLGHGAVYTLACVVQLGFYTLAVVGAWLERPVEPSGVPVPVTPVTQVRRGS